MILRLERRDRCGTIVITDAPPTATTPATARRTPEGYLHVRGLLARDGCLEYSDGRTSWNEYRPTSELRRGAPTFAGKPVTDDHPPVMLDASTWREHARGTIGDTVGLQAGPIGVQYMAADLLVQDAALIEAIEGGKVELSIGFTATVIDSTGVAPDGTKFEKIQTDIVGNHVSLVDQGRAGPECRVLLDGAAITTGVIAMQTKSTQGKAPVDVHKAAKQTKRGDIMAVEEAEITGPLGEKYTVPTFLAAMWEQVQNGKLVPAIEATPPPAEAAAPIVPEVPAAPVAVAPALEKPEDEEEEEKPPMADRPDSIESRVSLIADAVEILGRRDDMHTFEPDDIRRAVIRHCAPGMDTAGKTGPYLEALYDMAVIQHRQANKHRGPIVPRRNPWDSEPTTPKKDKRSVADISRAKYLAKFQ